MRQELKELNGPLEEAKADVSGLWALQHLMDKGVLDKKLETLDVHDVPRLHVPLAAVRPQRRRTRRASRCR